MVPGARPLAARRRARSGIVGFVLLARTEPSVLRAAVMGTVALLALGTDGRQRGHPRARGRGASCCCWSTPGWRSRPGSRCRCWRPPGILLLAPGWRDALARWLPRWLAEAIAVPAAAQLACTPVVAAISGQVSLVAVAANLAVAPAVGPATVLGLAGGLVGLVWAVGRPAARDARGAGAWPGSSTVADAAAPTCRRRRSAGGPARSPLGVLTRAGRS